jgi:hypothetical protein
VALPWLRELAVDDGWRLYLEHCARPQVMGGASDATRKRYRPVRDKHIDFCQARGIESWNEVGKTAVHAYGIWLSSDYADRSIFLERRGLVCDSLFRSFFSPESATTRRWIEARG